MEEKKHYCIKVGQDSAVTHGFNSAGISVHICTINVLWPVDVLIYVNVVRISLLANE